MNEKAKELGLENSHFESPHGLDSEGHYTTAYELAILTDYALQNPTFLNLVSTKNYTVTINGYPKTLSNTNELLGNLNGVYGVKTGFTNGANRCLVTACKRGEMDVICVVLGADTKSFRTKDSVKLIEYAFNTYQYFDIKSFVTNSLSTWQEDNPNFFLVEKGCSNSLELKVGTSLDDCPVVPIKKDLISTIETDFLVHPYLQSPISNGDCLGSLKVFSKDTVIAEFDLLSANSVRKNNVLDYMFDFFKAYPKQLTSLLYEQT